MISPPLQKCEASVENSVLIYFEKARLMVYFSNTWTLRASSCIEMNSTISVHKLKKCCRKMKIHLETCWKIRRKIDNPEDFSPLFLLEFQLFTGCSQKMILRYHIVETIMPPFSCYWCTIRALLIWLQNSDTYRTQFLFLVAEELMMIESKSTASSASSSDHTYEVD